MASDQSEGGTEQPSRDPNEPPTAAAFRLTTEAHTKLCIVGNELGDDEELHDLANNALGSCMELFERMAEKRDLDEDEFEDVYLDTGSDTWNRSVDTGTDRD